MLIPEPTGEYPFRVKAVAAFTLIELLVVMAVIGILGAAAAPTVGRWMEDYRVRAASRRLFSDLQFARMRAVADNIQCRVYFNPANNRYWIQGWNTGAGAWTQIGSTRQLSDAANSAYEAGITLAFSSGGDKTVTFSPLGQATAAITAGFSSTNYQRNVSVTTTGRMQIVQVRP